MFGILLVIFVLKNQYEALLNTTFNNSDNDVIIFVLKNQYESLLNTTFNNSDKDI